MSGNNISLYLVYICIRNNTNHLKHKDMRTIRTNKQHFDKYNSIVEQKGNLDHAMPATKDEIIEAINNGDIHLNSIELSKWDIKAYYVGATNWDNGKISKSLAEQVCTLKHYAIYKYAGFKPEFID